MLGRLASLAWETRSIYISCGRLVCQCPVAFATTTRPRKRQARTAATATGESARRRHLSAGVAAFLGDNENCRAPSFHWENIWTYEKEKNFYLLPPAIYDQLEESVQRVFAECDFYLTAVLDADPIVWMVKHSDTEYYRSMRSAVAMTNWVQMQSDQRLKLYVSGGGNSVDRKSTRLNSSHLGISY